jgi:hypothetical protein
LSAFLSLPGEESPLLAVACTFEKPGRSIFCAGNRPRR